MTRAGEGSEGRGAEGGARVGWALALMVLGTAMSVRASEPTAYDAIVAPIFQARCVECHGEQKQKAKLALHTWEAFAKGSDAGPIVVAGNPADSVLIQRMRLPLDDEEHMPPRDHPQPAADELTLLERWIERGAARSTALAALELSPSLRQAAAELPAKLAAVARPVREAEPVWELDARAVQEKRAPLAHAVAELQRKYPGALSYESRSSAALHFTAVGFGRSFADAELAPLGVLRDELVALDLSGTGITDKSAALLGTFTNLRTLRANSTALGDAAVAAIATLPSLESLALSDTRITPASVRPLTQHSRLRALRVAGTAAERAAQEANLPVPVSVADLLPPVEPEVKPASP